ncbi:MAG: hypothetical protein MEQ07_06865 [Aquimonas sp.]|nr:hypothetical protein [Aquimonas sp.]
MASATQTLPSWLEQAWLERYLARGLDSAQTAWFESYLLDKPHLIAQVEADSALRAVVSVEADPLRLQPAPRIAPIREPRLVWRGAALFVLGLGLGALGLQLLGPAAIDAASAPTRIVYDSLRGSYSAPRVDPGDPAAAVMIVEVAMPLGSRIQAASATVDGHPQPLPRAPVSSEGFATYTLPSAWRGRGVLRFELQLRDAGSAPTVEVTL